MNNWESEGEEVGRVCLFLRRRKKGFEGVSGILMDFVKLTRFIFSGKEGGI